MNNGSSDRKIKARKAADDIAVPVNSCLECQYMYNLCNDIRLSNIAHIGGIANHA
jgi:hypothetical protein